MPTLINMVDSRERIEISDNLLQILINRAYISVNDQPAMEADGWIVHPAHWRPALRFVLLLQLNDMGLLPEAASRIRPNWESEYEEWYDEHGEDGEDPVAAGKGIEDYAYEIVEQHLLTDAGWLQSEEFRGLLDFREEIAHISALREAYFVGMRQLHPRGLDPQRHRESLRYFAMGWCSLLAAEQRMDCFEKLTGDLLFVDDPDWLPGPEWRWWLHPPTSERDHGYDPSGDYGV